MQSKKPYPQGTTQVPHQFDRQLSVRYAKWLISNAWLMLLMSVIVLVAASAGFKNYLTDPDYRVYFAEDNPELLALERIEANYTRNDTAIFVVTPTDGNVFTRENLAAIEWLTEQAELLPMSGRIDSLTNFRHSQGGVNEYGEETIDSPALVENAEQLTDLQLASAKAFALNEPQLKKSLVATDGDVTAINVVFNLPEFDSVSRKATYRKPNEKGELVEVTEDRKTIISDIVVEVRTLRDAAQARYPNLTVNLNGILFLNNAFTESSEADQRSLIPWALVLTFVILILFLRSPAGILGTFLVMLASIASGMGLAFWFGIVLNSVTTMTPVIIMSLSIAHCVHIMISLQAGMRSGQSRDVALVEALRVNMTPIFLTSVTTAIGLLTLNFSESPPFRDLGNIIAIGVMAAWFFSVVLFPALLAALPARWSSGFWQRSQGKASSSFIQQGMAWLAELVIARRRLLLLLTSMIAIGLIAAITKNEIDDTYVHYFGEDTEFRDSSDYMDAKLGGVLPWNIEVCAKIPEATKQAVAAAGERLNCNQHAPAYSIADPGYLQDLDALAIYLRGLEDQVAYVNSFSDVMKRLNTVLRPEQINNYRLPEQRDIAVDYLFTYESSLPQGFDLNNQVNMNKSGTRLALTLKTISSQEQIVLANKVENWAEKNLSHIEPIVTVGTPLMFAKIGDRNIKAMLLGTLVALLLISFLLIIVLRSVRIGLLSIIPNVLPVAMAFGVWGLLVHEVGLALSIVASMTLGIVVDDTVHLLSKYLRARREKGLSAEDAIRYAFSTVGSALWVTSLALIGGFLIVAQAGYLPIAQMGWMTALTIGIALLADFLLLPPLLLAIDRKRKRT